MSHEYYASPLFAGGFGRPCFSVFCGWFFWLKQTQAMDGQSEKPGGLF
ncbi:hypothetical protein BH20ACI3_BH20ACI3_28960 [soil metagenome]